MTEDAYGDCELDRIDGSDGEESLGRIARLMKQKSINECEM